MKNQVRRIIISFIFILIACIFVHGNVIAEHCLDNLLPVNGRNMVDNPGFEEDTLLDNWEDPLDDPLAWPRDPAGVVTSFDDTYFYSGSRSAKVTWDGSSENQNYYHVWQTFNVIPGHTYRLNGYIKTENVYCDIPAVASWNGIRIATTDIINGWQYFAPVTDSLYGTNDWTNMSTEFTVPELTTQLRVQLRRFVGWQSGPSYGSAWWDDIQLLPVPVIYDITSLNDQITINGESFGVDPGAGNRNSEENCVLYEGVCIPDGSVISWSDSTIVIENVGEGVLYVRSGGIVSNAMIDEPDATLFNNTVSIYFPNIINGDGIGRITDTGTGRQFIDDSIAVKPLYEFTVKETPLNNTKTTISSKDASVITRHFSEENGWKTLTITASHCNEFTVNATVILPAGQGGARFSIDIQNHGNRVIQSVRYPLVAAKSVLGTTAADDTIVFPYFEGYLIMDPGNYTGSSTKDKDYPGSMTLQMLAFYDEEQPGAGLYLSSNDNDGYKKRFGFEKINKNGESYLLFSFLHITSEEEGNNLSVPYEVLISTFSGNWYDAADIYKQWALTQPWTSIRLTDRDDVPPFLFDIKTMIDCYGCPHEDYVALVNHYENLLDVQDILLYPGGFWGLNDGLKEGFYYTDIYNRQQPVKVSWSGVEYFSSDPVYDPGEENNPPFSILKTAVDDLRSQGSDVLLFLEGRPFWDQFLYKTDSNNPELATCYILDPGTEIPVELNVFDDRTDFYTYADPHVTIQENGSETHRFNFAFPSRPEDMADEYCRVTSTICVGSDNQNIMDLVIYNTIRRGIDHGARLMSLDGLVSGKIDGCWNPDHGHPLGEGKWTHDRYVTMLNDIRDIAISKGKYGEFGLSMEDPHELYLPHLQMQYLRHSDLSSIGNKKIPLFNYVYKDYYIGLERGMSLDSSNNQDMRWSLAMDFIQGNIQGTMVPSIVKPLDDDLIAYYKRLIKMKRADFYKGSMLHPPEFSGLPDEITISRSGRTYYIDPVLTNVLKTDEFTVSYLLVNSNLDGSGVSTIQLNAEQYDLPSDRVNVTIIKNSVELSKQLDMIITEMGPIRVDLDGGDVIEVRVEYWDFDGDGLNNNYELQIGTDPKDPDTDGDDLNDGDEIQHSTDPLNPDSDSDGLNDGAEVQLTTNPHHPDTDRDGILDGQDSAPLDIFSPNPEGWKLSKNSDFSTSDTEFSTTDTFHIIVWSNIADAEPMKKKEYKIKNTSGFVYKEDLVNTGPSVYAGDESLLSFATGPYTVEIWLRDGNNVEYERKDIAITIQ